MYCRICGDENGVQYWPRQRQFLCCSCGHDTPPKVDKETFKAKYFEGEEHVDRWILNNFYDDYLCSEHTLPEYIEATTSETLWG